METACSYSH